MSFDSDVTRLVGTYHKTGTVLMQNLFRQLARAQGLGFRHLNNAKLDLPGPQVEASVGDSGNGFCFDYHCNFDGFTDSDRFRGVRVIRDPRMLIVSAARYHLDSKEAWLHRPRKALAGKTYQQYLNELPDFRSQMRFEMGILVPGHGTAASIIRAMLAWADHPLAPCFHTVGLEDLMQDRGLDHYFRLFRHLGLTEVTLVQALHLALSNSMFTGKAVTNGHARGKVGETWEPYYDSDLLAEYQVCFGDAHTRLGYL